MITNPEVAPNEHAVGVGVIDSHNLNAGNAHLARTVMRGHRVSQIHTDGIFAVTLTGFIGLFEYL